MGSTDIYSLPYPAGGDPPAGMNQLEDLAVAVDDALAGKGWAGFVNVVLSAALTPGSSEGPVSVSFPGGRFASEPACSANVNNAAGASAGLVARCVNIDASGCDVLVINHGTANVPAGSYSVSVLALGVDP